MHPIPTRSIGRGLSSQPRSTLALGMSHAPTPLRGKAYAMATGAVQAITRESLLAPMESSAVGSTGEYPSVDKKINSSLVYIQTDKKGAIVKNILDRLSKLAFNWPRVEGMVEEMVDTFPSMLIMSMSQEMKVLQGELTKAIAKNDELEKKLDEMKWEMTDWKLGMESFKVEVNGRREGQDNKDGGVHHHPILSVSDKYKTSGLALTARGARLTSDDDTEPVL